MYGANTTSELRGDYSRARVDFTIDQDPGLYSAAEQEMWTRLYQRQSAIVQRYACAEFCFRNIEGDNVVNSGAVVFHEYIKGLRLRHFNIFAVREHCTSLSAANQFHIPGDFFPSFTLGGRKLFFILLKK